MYRYSQHIPKRPAAKSAVQQIKKWPDNMQTYSHKLAARDSFLLGNCISMHCTSRDKKILINCSGCNDEKRKKKKESQ